MLPIKQFAQYFGVSNFTIIQWMSEGRFIGVQKSENCTSVLICEDALWMTKTGKLYSVSQIIEEWEVEQAQLGVSQTLTEEIAFLKDQIALYEEKYEGDIKSTLALKKILTSEEETDAAAWSYFNNRLENLY